jgi:hypothetical protein
MRKFTLPHARNATLKIDLKILRRELLDNVRQERKMCPLVFNAPYGTSLNSTRAVAIEITAVVFSA